MSLPEVLASARRYPGMYFAPVSYETAVAFVNGYDAALRGGLLMGFHEWLIVQAGDGHNLVWSGVIRMLAERAGGESREDEEGAVEQMFAYLEAFLSERERPGGLRRIYRRYEAWLGQQSWYSPSSPDWIP